MNSRNGNTLTAALVAMANVTESVIAEQEASGTKNESGVALLRKMSAIVPDEAYPAVVGWCKDAVIVAEAAQANHDGVALFALVKTLHDLVGSAESTIGNLFMAVQKEVDEAEAGRNTN